MSTPRPPEKLARIRLRAAAAHARPSRAMSLSVRSGQSCSSFPARSRPNANGVVRRPARRQHERRPGRQRRRTRRREDPSARSSIPAGIELTAIMRVLKLTVLRRLDHRILRTAPRRQRRLQPHRRRARRQGQHARAAFGVAALPLGAAVEVEAVVEVD